MSFISVDNSVELFLEHLPSRLLSDGSDSVKCEKFSYVKCRNNNLYKMVEQFKKGDNKLLKVIQEKYPEYRFTDIEVTHCDEHTQRDGPYKANTYGIGMYYMYFNIFYMG